MSAWRRQSLRFLPECRAIIEAAPNPMGMWCELSLRFDKAMSGGDREFALRFIRLAAWSASERSGPLPNDTSTAAVVAFYEHLPTKREYWPCFRQWFTQQEFDDFLPYFSYHLSENAVSELRKCYTSVA